MAAVHNRWSNTDIIDLITGYPLAMLVSRGAKGFGSTPLPMLPEVDESGALVRLLGHMSLANPQADVLRQQPDACFIFQGPHGYVSPTLVPDRSWAPTWNYAVVRVNARVRFRPELNDTALRQLVARMEAGRADAWQVEEMGERYRRLSLHVTAFHAEVASVEATFKLGQEEKPLMFDSIIAGLDNPGLVEWMQRFRDRVGGS
jgi:transcriptional regulator